MSRRWPLSHSPSMRREGLPRRGLNRSQVRDQWSRHGWSYQAGIAEDATAPVMLRRGSRSRLGSVQGVRHALPCQKVRTRSSPLDIVLPVRRAGMGAAGRAYVTARDLCARWKCSRATLYRWIEGGYVPRPVRFGPRVVRWAAKDIEGFEQQLANDSGTGGDGAPARDG